MSAGSQARWSVARSDGPRAGRFQIDAFRCPHRGHLHLFVRQWLSQATEGPWLPHSTGSPPVSAAAAPADRAPAGQLATTGVDGDRTGLLAGIAALLIGVGITALAAVRRRRADGTA
ncbi:hypothetical protein [Kitasatospora sp. NPDC088346]|uniref:hypothetical protein n=1 Tax=Kitasatospora sp. NPDC088346 TaxID=3364073 RepID=UPI00382934F8